MTVTLETGESRRFGRDDVVSAAALLRFIGTDVSPSAAPLPIATSPTVDESWALLHYDLAITLSSLEDRRPWAQLRSIERDGDTARLTLEGMGRLLVQEVRLRGRELEGASVDLMMEWNRAD